MPVDSATRNFLGLVSIALTLAAYAICGLVAYVLIPSFGLRAEALARLGPACLLPAAVLVTLIAISIGLALRDLFRQAISSRRLSRQVGALAVPTPPALLEVARAAGLQGRVEMIDSSSRFSFVHGVLVPRVAISRGLLESLEPGELRAALEHERYHVRHLDPLRALLGRILTDAFFLLPSLRVLRLRYEAGRELAADRRAERACGRRALLGALVKALEEPRGELPAGASLAGPGSLGARISFIETGRAPALATASVPSLLTTALGAGSFLLFVRRGCRRPRRRTGACHLCGR